MEILKKLVPRGICIFIPKVFSFRSTRNEIFSINGYQFLIEFNFPKLQVFVSHEKGNNAHCGLPQFESRYPLHGEKIERDKRGTNDKQTTWIIYTSHETSFDTISAQTAGSERSDRNNRVLQSARRFALSRALFLVTTSWIALDTIYSSAVSVICATQQFAAAERYRSSIAVEFSRPSKISSTLGR